MGYVLVTVLLTNVLSWRGYLSDRRLNGLESKADGNASLDLAGTAWGVFCGIGSAERRDPILLPHYITRDYIVEDDDD
ncbi:hypothetical protein A3H77_02510 [Candidatus Kaiserbacteria bacterium RIFCSPLOWO2_02_FULL_56_11]|uniref:Uncharacterized protein n=1 Tax=Candidatus Kaiserbacteria bacterium RIFCSPHIGHO2_02_FULL_56_30 TaxID=1798499 RepID=A0A1F6E3W6_9BACT|nr:MAG: hypothetical protein A3C95_01720 [Candidatus Kaiserbacteria bacterium RIFCSPHIGHO2_02_FULL_56_30]OGG82080.1 MAG: hypothetical protein A3H77_02510 [Candidatus Kaiserbacteria bacterium RIFCSPLOWO2_02_FULL_56_11]